MGKPRAAALGTGAPATTEALTGRYISIGFTDSPDSTVIRQNK